MKHGSVFRCESIKVAANNLKTFNYLHGMPAHGAFKNHVFAKMGQAFLALLLVSRANSNLKATINDRRLSMPMNDSQSGTQSNSIID